MFEKTYDAADIEPRIARVWEEAGAFRAGAGAPKGARPFSIVIPPPNVTGSLHMGHALNNTLQDVLARFERMRGRDVLWQPGTDHAGIATQMVVEKIWEWKEKSGGTIQTQLKRLGASCDWSRERFTMDEGLSKAVRDVFVRLYKQGLIYRDKRLVNWDPKFQTAISDLEVVGLEVDGKLWHFRYPLADDPTRFVTVATTRPETMLGDSGIAVHPSDERWRGLVGKRVRLPLVGRMIPIVADEYADPETGSGAVKITPAHDFNDFEVGKRNRLAMINVMDAEARIALAGNETFSEGIEGGVAAETMALDGLDRFAARKRVVEMMDAAGFLEKVEDHRHVVPHGDRSSVPIEPVLTDQWYVNARRLAAPAIDAVRRGETSFVPRNWERTYFDWMENIQPWCISRQLWWGHQIPAWYGPDGRVFVEKTEEDAVWAAAAFYSREVRAADRDTALAAANAADAPVADRPVLIWRDEDVLDTWFSSALWPFSTLGWPDRTPELRRYYPTSVLVTGFDIIFFWVARMMMMGLHFCQEKPFDVVYIHALVRDEKGAKMSKSKGNVIDPIELIDQYGADALRFTLAAMAAQGRDIKLAPARVQGYRNFATKLWNAVRFADMNECRIDPAFDPTRVRSTLARWIVVELSKAVEQVTDALVAYRFNDAAGAVYAFTWNTFCDWYLEFAKPVLLGSDEAMKAEIRATTAHVIDGILRLLHPFMPFLTEELWRVTAELSGIGRETLIAHAPWPDIAVADNEASDEINWIVGLIAAVRSVRAEMNVPAAAEIPLVVVGATTQEAGWLDGHEPALRRLARLSDVATAAHPPAQSAQIVYGGATVALPLGEVIDLSEERRRLEKELERIAADIARIDAKLANPQFTARAPEEVVEEQRERRDEAEARRERILEALGRLEGVA